MLYTSNVRLPGAIKFQRFFSLDSPKAIKARKFGYINAINYMAPHRLASVGDLCPWSSDACRALCLGEHSGNAALYPTVLQSRIRKAQYFMRDRQAFIAECSRHIWRAASAARKARKKLCVRLNGATDIPWEGVAPQLFAQFPRIQFVDYTKSVKRALAHAKGELPANYHLTFSRSESNETDCDRVLAAGGNVAVVFAGDFPTTWHGFQVIDGDLSDLRHLDPRGVVVGLSPKGMKAKKDSSGFVVRAAA